VLYLIHAAESNQLPASISVDVIITCVTSLAEWELEYLQLNANGSSMFVPVTMKTSTCLETIKNGWKHLAKIVQTVGSLTELTQKPKERAISLFPMLSLISNYELISVIGNWKISCLDDESNVSWSIASMPVHPLTDSHKNTGRAGSAVIAGFQQRYIHRLVRRLFPIVWELKLGWNKENFGWEVYGCVTRFGEELPFKDILCWSYSAPNWLCKFHLALENSLFTATIQLLSNSESDQTTCVSELINSGKPGLCLWLAERIAGWQAIEHCLTTERVDNRTKLLKLRNNSHPEDCLSPLDRLAQSKCQMLCGVLLELNYGLNCLLQDPDPTYTSLTWLQMFKHQLCWPVECGQRSHHKQRPSIVVRQFNFRHSFGWRGKALTVGTTNDLIVPPLPNSQELLMLGMALAKLQPGLLAGPTGNGRQTTILQFATLLGRHVMEYSGQQLTTQLAEFGLTGEVRLQALLREEMLKCLRSGSLLVIRDIQTSQSGRSNRLKPAVDSVCDDHELQEGKWKTCMVNDHPITMNPGFGVFFTTVTANLHSMPDTLRRNFRSVELTVPDWSFVADHLCTAHYLPTACRAARTKQQLAKLLDLVHCGRKSYQPSELLVSTAISWSLLKYAMRIASLIWNRKFSDVRINRIKAGLRSADVYAEEEDRLAEMSVVRGLLRAWTEVTCRTPTSSMKPWRSQVALGLPTMQEILLTLKAVFPTGYKQAIVQKRRNLPVRISWRFFEQLLKELKTRQLELIPGQIEKITELYGLLTFRKHVMIIGRVASGKTTIWQLLANTLNQLCAVQRRKPSSSEQFRTDDVNNIGGKGKYTKWLTTLPDAIRESIEQYNLTGTDESDKNIFYETVAGVQIERSFPGALNERSVHRKSEVMECAADFVTWMVLDTGDQLVSVADMCLEQHVMCCLEQSDRKGRFFVV
ncbi:hypothetical protein EG68_01962, partial [Paragonimus skrjabini miyazakii]